MVTDTSTQLELRTIYDNPRDFQGQFVSRRFDITSGQEPQPASDALLGETFEQIREHFDRQGYNWLDRNASYDPMIVGAFLR
ncbi:hypothetical protein [Pectobacterium atrosepticum]|uniref:hypothetical protein n=1 Tax=Pectobacterium atrosepticum TaxID=29471 RepID=UPI0015E7FBB0|nr:hypothetical protein [Pectobacterium atrosepticum]